MSPPTIIQQCRQLFGRALRESGQALDRVGVKTAMLAVTKHDFYDDPVIYEDHLSRHRHQFPLLDSGRPIIDANVAFLAPCSTLIGTVVVGKNSSIWYGAVLRGDHGEFAESFHHTYPMEEKKVEPAGKSAISSGKGEGEQEQEGALEQQQQQPQKLEPWEIDESVKRDQLDHHGGGIFIGDNTNIQDNCIITSRIDHTKIGNGVTIGHMAQIHSSTIGDFCLIGMGSVLNAGVVVEDEAFIAAGTVVPPNTTIPSGELWVGNPARKLRDLTHEQRQKLHYQSTEYVQVALSQRKVMELGGNLDPKDGSCVYLIREEDDDGEETTMTPEQLEQQQTSAVGNDASATGGRIPPSNRLDGSSSPESSRHYDEVLRIAADAKQKRSWNSSRPSPPARHNRDDATTATDTTKTDSGTEEPPSASRKVKSSSSSSR